MIVYLDQNFVSNVAKAWLRRKGYEVFLELSLVLEDLLRKGKIKCPASYFHFVETEVDIALSKKIEEVVKRLSSGFMFIHWREILKRQILNLFCRFTGKEPVYTHSGEAFVRIPYGDWKDFYPVEEKEALNNEKVRYVMGMERMRKSFNRMDIYDLTSYIKDRLIEEYVFEFLGGVADKEVVESFARSNLARSIPFIDIYASLSACFVLYDSNRQPKESDRVDLLMASTILPYVDIFATDRYIKNNLVTKLHFDRKYEVSIFSGKINDVKEIMKLLLALL